MAAAKAATSRLVAELAVSGSEDARGDASLAPAWLFSHGRTAAEQAAPTERQEGEAPAEVETGAAGDDAAIGGARDDEMQQEEEEEPAAKGQERRGKRAAHRSESVPSRRKGKKSAAAAAAQDDAGAFLFTQLPWLQQGPKGESVEA